MNLLTIHLLCTAPKPVASTAPRMATPTRWFHLLHKYRPVAG